MITENCVLVNNNTTYNMTICSALVNYLPYFHPERQTSYKYTCFSSRVIKKAFKAHKLTCKMLFNTQKRSRKEVKECKKSSIQRSVYQPVLLSPWSLGFPITLGFLLTGGILGRTTAGNHEKQRVQIKNHYWKTKYWNMNIVLKRKVTSGVVIDKDTIKKIVKSRHWGEQTLEKSLACTNKQQ